MSAATDALTLAYGPFTPGSPARAIRDEHAERGQRTCWHCLSAFSPRRVANEDGQLRRLGRGRWYCSTECAQAERADAFARDRALAALRGREVRSRHLLINVGDDGSVVLDLSRGRRA